MADEDESPAAPAEAGKADAKEDDRRDQSSVAGNLVRARRYRPRSRADSRKLIRNAQLELQVTNYETAIERLTTFAAEAEGFVATQSSSEFA